jgi:hypothetical protein
MARRATGCGGRVIAFIALVVWVSMSGDAAAQRGPELPPGVELLTELPGREYLPPGVLIHVIEVDWTEPLLSVGVEAGLAAGNVRDRGGDRDDARAEVRIQVATARWRGEGGGTKLRVKIPEAEGGAAGRDAGARKSASRGAEPGGYKLDAGRRPTARFTGENEVRIGGIAPWTYAGPGVAELPGWSNVVAEGSAAAGLQWLGTFAQWLRTPPPVAIQDRVLLSSLNPMTGQGRFLLVVNGTGRYLRLDALTDWMQQNVGSQQLVAVHADGPEIEIAQGGWRLSGQAEVPRSSGPGAVVVLGRRETGDRVDVGRLFGSVQATSREFAYPPDQVLSGRLWATGLRPSIWMSRPMESGAGEGPRLTLQMAQAREVEEIQLIHAEAAGWSGDFNPRRFQVRLYGQNSLDAPVVIDCETAGEPVTRIRLNASRSVAEVGIEWSQPTAFDVPAPARLMGLQAWGRLKEGER